MSIPTNEMAAILSSGQAVMTPQQAALAATEGVPFAFPATPGAAAQFAASVAPTGQVSPVANLSSAQADQQSNALYNTLLSKMSGGAAAEQAAGISVPTTTTTTTAAKPISFSWLDPWPWIKNEGLNIMLIVIGVVTIIIVVTALFRAANSSAPASYVKENAKAAIGAAKTIKKTLTPSPLTATAEDVAELAAVA